MALTVSEMLRIGSLKGLTLLAGEKGTRERTVSTVVVIDTPEAHQWLRGGEFLITSGYIFCERPLELLAFVEGAGRSKAAAFGVKIGRYLGKIPNDVLESANRLHFPIIGIPEHFNHVDIIHPVIATITHDDYNQAISRDKINNLYTNLILNGASVDDIIQKTAELIDTDIAFLDIRTGCFFATKYSNITLNNTNNFNKIPILLEEKPRAYLFMEKSIEKIDNPEFSTTLDIAKKHIAILMQREDAEIRIENYHIEDFLKNLLYNKNINENDVKRKAKFYKWDLSWNLAIAIIKDGPNVSEDRGNKPLFESLLLKIRLKFIGSLGLASDHNLVLFVPLKTKNDSNVLFEYMQGMIAHENHENSFYLTCGLSSIKNGLCLAREAFSEAQKALDVVMRTSNNPPIRVFDEIGLDGILSILKDTEMGQNFIDKQLGPLLLKHNSPKRFNLMETLEALVRHDWQIGPAAADLKIHYNTMKYRIRCLEEALDLTDHDGRRRTELALAVLLYQIDKKASAS
ncbi:PucR family transcriptional regulator ligand-binding domain-containing protein [Aminithiophilus ramosus]|uniref:PucR family transcriptional regulator ligand-binding domain-containing protein n=1 Tax=Aminithiophilus ramosus TaxID=3029084 RepID=A0A9Q7EVH6_9BACT|nr:PucR family transcriptional regulator [Aminithiophilus ramosus]QTX31989.1 PucR family transcriptional regulator ligand-binding domain-containing protein [Aminithiophilus ramosus]